MTRPLTIVMLGPPVAFARTRTGNGAFFTPVKQRNTAATLRMLAQTEMQAAGISTYAEPIAMHVRAEFPVPASWSKKKKAAALLGIVRPGKPDLDNVAKLASDALNHVAFVDDSLIAELRAEKRYSNEPKLVLTIRPLLRPLERAEAAE